VKLLIIQSFPASCYFLPLKSNYPHHPVFKHLLSSPTVRNQVLHSYKTTSKILVLYILISKVLERKQKRQKILK
jgi:hypothetical protein